ncbi:antitoxin [Streptomyces sp. NBC_00669]|uniref:antitoxin n=1 Tax=unclassified Streptomyces TaxID=2593676 RepID=UPI002E2F9465|nr:antitoxin [Streptomyces sp. NBC_00669]
MSFMDSLKGKLGVSKDKAADLAKQHGDKIQQGLDKAAKTVDSKTGGKYSNQINSGVGKAKDAVKGYGDKGRDAT